MFVIVQTYVGKDISRFMKNYCQVLLHEVRYTLLTETFCIPRFDSQQTSFDFCFVSQAKISTVQNNI